MRITNVETIHLRLPEIELRADGTQDAFIVRIDTDEGVSGYGEADTSPTVAQAFVDMPASHSMLVGHARDAARPRPVRHRADLARPLRDDRARGHRARRRIHTISAIDIALHDLVGPARSGSPSTSCSAAPSAIRAACTPARSCRRRPTRCGGT